MPAEGILLSGSLGQIRERGGRFRLGRSPGRGGADGKSVRVREPALQARGEGRRLKILFGEQIGGADAGETFGIHGLVVVGGGGERHKDRRPAGNLQLRH